MNSRAVLIAITCLAVGLAAGAWLPSRPVSTESAPPGDAGIEDRVLALERALENERGARQLLEDELFELLAEVETLRADRPSIPSQPAPTAVETPIDMPVARTRRARGGSVEDRAATLVASGFSQDRAAFIARREAELRMEAMQARFEARQAGEPVNFGSAAFNADQTLRGELGADEYEQYLAASGRPTAISVNSVLEFSPAAQAGLQRGDEIVRYNGERVYNIFDLNQQQAQTTAGQNVVVDVMRDGQPIQVTLPAGPLGITGGRRR